MKDEGEAVGPHRWSPPAQMESAAWSAAGQGGKPACKKCLAGMLKVLCFTGQVIHFKVLETKNSAGRSAVISWL